MPFLTPLALSYIGRGRYVTTAELKYEGQWDVLTVPTGTTTDLASVPRVFWALLPPHGAYETSAVLHDWLCDWLNRGDQVVPSRDVDALFRRCCREAGVGVVRRWLLWWGCRLGALMNPSRRAGWWRDLVPITAITLTVLAVAAAVLAVLGWVVCEVAG